MKRLIVLLLVIFPICLSAQDKIHTLDGKTLFVKVVEFGISDVLYKEYDNLEGPNYRISTENLLSVELENGIIKVFNEIPQGFEFPSSIVYKRGTIYGDGNEIPKSDYVYLFGEDGLDSYNTGEKFRSAASSLGFAGFAGICGGLLYFGYEISNSSSYNEKEINRIVNVGGTVVGLGVCCLIASIPFYSIGKNKINNLVDDYNTKHSLASISFGISNNGIGLSVIF